MTLRSRLVVALVVLVLVALGVFGFTTYSLYSRSQYKRLDDQIRSSLPLVTRQLDDVADGVNRSQQQPGNQPQHQGGPPVVIPGGTFAQLLAPDGTALATVRLVDESSQPNLSGIGAPTTARFVTTGSVAGSTRWRVFVMPDDRVSGQLIVVAVPMNEVSSGLNKLVVIEIVATLAVVAVLGVGAWLILRRGLRPLEHMASSARSIAGGDLSLRVAPSDDRTEVGQLGLALNTMLSEIELAFLARDATEERLRQFLADASHELRTPLTSIQGFAELSRMKTGAERVDQEVVMRRIEEEAARMKRLVEDLLLLARLDRTTPPQSKAVDLTVLAADACTDAVAVAPDRKVTLDAPEPVVILGSEDHLRQAIANLVSNAIAHTPAGTPIEVSVRIAAGAVEITVRDYGAGLDEAALAHAFDRFWQADPSRKGHSAGLGLSIVAAIATEHGGRASVVNPPGGGAAFSLHLPLNEVEVGSNSGSALSDF